VSEKLREEIKQIALEIEKNRRIPRAAEAIDDLF
jgi:hypothetical protein